MAIKRFTDFWRKPRGLRIRVALVIGVPILVTLTLLSLIHYWRARHLLVDQIQLTALQVGDVAFGSLHHAMIENNPPHLDQVIQDLGRMESVERVQVVDWNRRVTHDSTGRDQGRVRQLNELGCKECHGLPDASQSRTVILIASDVILRISTPIDNQMECLGCHAESRKHLGTLLIDMSFNDARVQLINDLRTDLLLSAGATVLISVGIYLLVHWLIVRRVEAFRFPLMKFAKGDFSSRLDTPVNPRDEIDQLAWAFNRTADELERHQHEQEQRHDLRRRAIIEERERIAREIHDGIAQLMGYVSTKAAAVRLLLEKQQLDEAQIQAHQLMRASQEAFVELRATILGLRTSDTDDTDFVAMLEEFSSKFSQMSGIEVDTMFPSDRDKISLPPDTELHLLRITQEALSNVQKHTSTKQAWVALTVEDHTLELTIGDNGRGFDPTQIPANRRPHFGLSTMSERASAIGATFVLDSKPGEGTRVSVRLPLE